MADINKEQIKLMESQRLDDTDQGGGQMTAHEIVDGAVNNLFPDISRLDRVYGRVSMRKCYLSVQTANRETYYGSHTILTKQADDPNVFVCFFSSKDWFDTRLDARNRIEAYLVKGPHSNLKLWGDHYLGTSLLKFITIEGWPIPEIGDVLVMIASQEDNAEQYVRVIDVSAEMQEFFSTTGGADQTAGFYRNVVSVKIGTQLKYDMIGSEVYYHWNAMVSDDVYTTVAADASRYYGIATLAEDIVQDTLQLRVDDYQTNLVPSAASETAVTDAGVGVSISPVITTQTSPTTVTRSILYNIHPNAKFFIGEGVNPKEDLTISLGGGIVLTHDNSGNVYNGSVAVGSVAYATGIVTFGEPGFSTSGTGTVTYTPACAPQQVSETGAIVIDTNNRGFVYVFNCNPIPEPRTLKVEYLAGGKWYTLWDEGNGKIVGLDPKIGSGQLSYDTGSLSVTLGAMPDVDSKVIFFWAKPAEYYDLSGETLPLSYAFMTNHTAIARNTFALTWVGDGNGTGPDGDYAIVDDGNGQLVTGQYNWGLATVWAASTSYDVGSTVRPTTPNGFAYECTTQGASGGGEPAWPTVDGTTVNDGSVVWECVTPAVGDWEPAAIFNEVGFIRYATGEVRTAIDIANQDVPQASTIFTIIYNYGDKILDEFNMPPRDGNGHIELYLTNTPIVPGTFKIEWHNDLEVYDPETRIDMTKDPTYIFRDDGQGKFLDDENDGTTGWFQGTIDYSSGRVYFHPDRRSVFPFAVYEWVVTGWMHPGVEESYLFDHIEYYPAPSLFPTDGNVTCEYCAIDGTNFVEYSGTMEAIYIPGEDRGLEIIPGGLSVRDASGTYMVDGTDGKLYTHVDGVNGNKVEMGRINYVNKSIHITSDVVNLTSLTIERCDCSGKIEPTMTLVFRAPGAPIRPNSVFIRGTTGAGTVIEGNSDGNGDITGVGIVGHVNYNTGLCHVSFGTWVPDNTSVQDELWYPGAPDDGAGNVWKPYVVRASTILMNCVITSYLPLDPELLGLDPVRLPMDGRVPIFRDGYIIVIHQSADTILSTEYTGDGNQDDDPTTFLGRDTSGDTPPGCDNSNLATLACDQTESCGTTNVDLLEVYKMPTTDQIEKGQLVCSEYIPDAGNYTVDLDNGTVTFLAGFTQPVDDLGIRNTIVLVSRIEDMCLASDVQVTGHIAVTSPITHAYDAGIAKVSSVLPSADLQSRAYNEFEQSTWNGIWEDFRQGAEPLASYNFVDYPITVYNGPSIKERWLLLFGSPSTVDVVGENFGVLIQDVHIDILTGLPIYSHGDPSGTYMYNGEPCLVLVNKNFYGAGSLVPAPYFVINLNGFGFGWQAGNCIRFNEDAANFPLWFVRTTLQAPPTEPVDYYTIQIRGDSS
jgi:hypothetical protein